jgi:predicted aminopeptidase
MWKSLALLLILSQTACYFPYLLKQGWYQTKLLHGAKPVDEVLLESSLNESDRKKLLMITVIRRFSVNEMAMHPSKNYTTINPDWHYQLHQVSGAKELAFEPYLWSFPIVGDVPYLGFFEKEDALAEQKMLKAKGYDTMLRPVAAYSSLGYFNDPIWPQMLKRSVHALAELILHELAHSTLYFKSQSDFNESFANFVGRVGALQFLQRNYGSHSFELYDAILTNEDEVTFGAWIEGLHDSLDEVYKRVQSDANKRKLKAEEIVKATHAFDALHFRSSVFRSAKAPEVNNAYLMMFRRYNKGLDDFEKIYIGLGGDWAKFYDELKALRSESDPFAALHKMAAKYDLGES